MRAGKLSPPRLLGPLILQRDCRICGSFREHISDIQLFICLLNRYPCASLLVTCAGPFLIFYLGVGVGHLRRSTTFCALRKVLNTLILQGTIVVVLGVVGIVGFGSINSGLHPDMDLDRLKTIWSRPGWLSYFLLMTIAIIIVYVGTSQLDAILATRSDLAALPTTRPKPVILPKDAGLWANFKVRWNSAMHWSRERLDTWTAAKDDNTVAWMLGIGWSCVGGGLAGACLVVCNTNSVHVEFYADVPASLLRLRERALGTSCDDES